MSINPTDNLTKDKPAGTSRPQGIVLEKDKQGTKSFAPDTNIQEKVPDSNSNETDIVMVKSLLDQKTQEQLKQAKHAKQNVKGIPISQRKTKHSVAIPTSAMREQPLEAKGLAEDVAYLQGLKSAQMEEFAMNYEFYLEPPKVGTLFKSVVVGVVMAILIFLVAVIGGGLALGFQPYVVSSDSMAPDIPDRSLIVVKGVNPVTLVEGDDISFNRGGLIVTQRIESIFIDSVDPDNSYVKTYCINEIAPAETVYFGEIIGKVLLVVPGVGNMFAFVKEYFYIVIMVIVAIILIWLLVTRLISRRRTQVHIERLLDRQRVQEEQRQKEEAERKEKQFNKDQQLDLIIDGSADKKKGAGTNKDG